MAYRTVHWRQRGTLTTVTENRVMARGAHSLTVCVCVCTQQCCGDSESERQTGKERQTLHLFFPLLLCLTRSLSEALIVPLFMPVLCVREGARAKEASGNGRWQCARARAHVWVCEVATLLVRLYLRAQTHGVPRPLQTHWANDQPWQLKSICESVWHQEGHLLPAL